MLVTERSEGETESRGPRRAASILLVANPRGSFVIFPEQFQLSFSIQRPRRLCDAAAIQSSKGPRLRAVEGAVGILSTNEPLEVVRVIHRLPPW